MPQPSHLFYLVSVWRCFSLSPLLSPASSLSDVFFVALGLKTCFSLLLLIRSCWCICAWISSYWGFQVFPSFFIPFCEAQCCACFASVDWRVALPCSLKSVSHVQHCTVVECIYFRISIFMQLSTSTPLHLRGKYSTSVTFIWKLALIFTFQITIFNFPVQWKSRISRFVDFEFLCFWFFWLKNWAFLFGLRKFYYSQDSDVDDLIKYALL